MDEVDAKLAAAERSFYLWERKISGGGFVTACKYEMPVVPPHLRDLVMLCGDPCWELGCGRDALNNP